MPPMLTDDDDSDSVDVPEQIPARKQPVKEAEEAEDEEADEDDEDDGEADEYRVEAIKGHDFTKDGTTIYQIKWLGYEAKTDLTWEPIENLENAKDILVAYHKKIGGEPVFEPKTKSAKKGPASGKAGKRSASDAFAGSPAPASTATKKRGRKSAGTNGAVADDFPTNKRDLPVGSWEDHITRVTSIIEEMIPERITAKGKEKEHKELTGLLEWNDDGPKTQHKLKVLRQKCPQKLLDYYEQHLKFTI